MSTFAVVAHRVTPTNTRLGTVAHAGAGGRAARPRRRRARPARRPAVARRRRAGPLGARPARSVGRDRAQRTPRRSSRRTTSSRPPTALFAAGVPHPRTVHVAPWLPLPELEAPIVLKPRFGSWGADVIRCDDAESDRARARGARATGRGSRRPARSRRSSSRRAATTCASSSRAAASSARCAAIAAPGEWRTNVALGARREPVSPPPEACCDRARRRGGDRRRSRRRRPAAGRRRHLGRARGERRRRLHERVLASSDDVFARTRRRARYDR